MSLALAMIQANVPLHRWKTFEAERRMTDRSSSVEIGGWGRTKDWSKVARALLNSCSHPDAVDLIAREFNQFPELLRINFRTLAIEAHSASGNVRKGIARLNDRLGGAILRDKDVQTFNQRVEGVDGARYKKVRVDPAVAGAMRKYGIIK